MKPQKEIRLHTYGIVETEDFYFKSEERALAYAMKWYENGKIQGFKIYDPSGRIIQKAGKFRCLDWDKVEKFYQDQKERNTK